MTKVPSMKELLEAGAHFGHEARRWNPKMSQYIFTTRDGIHVIDLEHTEKMLQVAVDFLRDEVASGSQVVFLATKKQAQDFTREQAQRSGAMFMTTRWVGGLFTNFETVLKTLKRFRELSDQRANAAEMGLTKKEQSLMDRKIAKIERVFGGVKDMETLPDIIFIVDAKKELNAVLEARKSGVKIVAISDTNSDPTLIDYPIPANDDAIKAIQLIVRTVADAVEEGMQLRDKKVIESEKLKVKSEEEVGKAEEKSKVEVKEKVAARVKEEPKKEKTVKAVKEKPAKKETKAKEVKVAATKEKQPTKKTTKAKKEAA